MSQVEVKHLTGETVEIFLNLESELSMEKTLWDSGHILPSTHSNTSTQ